LPYSDLTLGNFCLLFSANLAQASWFAMRHYSGGFPCGLEGFLMCLLWAMFLGCLYWWAGGIALVLFDHVVADFALGCLVLREKRLQGKHR